VIRQRHNHPKVLSYFNLILNKAPELLFIADSAGQLPLHVAASETHVPLAMLERLVVVQSSHAMASPAAAASPCRSLGDLPLHKLVMQHPLPKLAAVTLLTNVYPQGLRHCNHASYTPLALFLQCSRFTLELQHYHKARSIVLLLLDRTLPFHQIAMLYHCIPHNMLSHIMRDNAKASLHRDTQGMYAWQIAAMQPLTPVSCVFELLRLAPTTLEHARQQQSRTKMR
jgi:hypothetical protein